MTAHIQEICPGCEKEFMRDYFKKGRPQVYCSIKCRNDEAQIRYWRKKNKNKEMVK